MSDNRETPVTGEKRTGDFPWADNPLLDRTDYMPEVYIKLSEACKDCHKPSCKGCEYKPVEGGNE